MLCYLSQYELSRGFVTMTFAIGTPVLLAERFAVRKTVHWLRRRGAVHNRVVVVGETSAITEIARILQRERYVGYTVVAACAPLGSPAMSISSRAQSPSSVTQRVCERLRSQRTPTQSLSLAVALQMRGTCERLPGHWREAMSTSSSSQVSPTSPGRASTFGRWPGFPCSTSNHPRPTVRSDGENAPSTLPVLWHC